MPAVLKAPPDETLIDSLLREQARLDTPVARLAKRHGKSGGNRVPSIGELIPLTAPAPGGQYAFEVNLDRCTGCKACVAACHSMNGLDEEETWRETGLLHGGSSGAAYMQTVTTACHHCADPACLNGCPVNAYEKDAATGIVLHLDDQCIGCQYCALKCPYDAPKYSKKLGIVRKCDMCHSRLANGEAPACVQACPTQAIRIVEVDTASNRFLPGTVDPQYTFPTTRYIGSRAIPQNVVAADHGQHKPEPAHWPLVGMLTLTQASVGLCAAAMPVANPLPHLLASLAFCLLGLGVSVLHLGRPLKAWRVFVGIGHSWLSREIIVFGGYFPLLAGAAFLSSPLTDLIPWQVPNFALPMATGAALLTGLLGVFCSAMLYHDTRRPFWKLQRTALSFASTATIIASSVCLLIDSFLGKPSFLAPSILIVTSLAKLAAEAAHFRVGNHGGEDPIAGSRKLLLDALRPVFLSRIGLGGVGGILLPVLFLITSSPLIAAAGFLATLAAETLERLLFFRAVVRFKMPGSIPTP